MSVCLSVCLSLSIYLSVYLFVCLSVCLSVLLLTATFSVHLPCSSPRAVVSLEALFSRAAVCAMFLVSVSFSATLWSYIACNSAIWNRQHASSFQMNKLGYGTMFLPFSRLRLIILVFGNACWGETTRLSSEVRGHIGLMNVYFCMLEHL